MFVVFLERRTQIRIAMAFLVFVTLASLRVGTIVSSHAWQVDAGLAPIRSIGTDQGVVALSFDVEEGQEVLTEVLSVLRVNQIQATFFINGQWAENHPEMVQLIYQHHHEVANGGYTSEKHPPLGPEGVARSIGDTHRSLRETLGNEPTALFRPPGGYSNQMVVETALEEGYHTVLWRLDSRDSVTRHADRTINWVKRRARAGDIIRFSASDRGHEAGKIVQGVIEALKERGLSPTTVGKLIQRSEH